MAVPNTNTFSFWDVADEIYGYVGGSMTLDDLFQDANANGFVSAYAGAKDRLSNFRGYNHGNNYYSDPVVEPRSYQLNFLTYTGASQSLNNFCYGSSSYNYPRTIYQTHYSATQYTWFTFDHPIYQQTNGTALVLADAGWYKNGSVARRWTGTSWTGSANACYGGQ